MCVVAGFCKGITCDLSKEEQQQALVEAVSKETGGRVHVLVNNSGTYTTHTTHGL